MYDDNSSLDWPTWAKGFDVSFTWKEVEDELCYQAKLHNYTVIRMNDLNYIENGHEIKRWLHAHSSAKRCLVHIGLNGIHVFLPDRTTALLFKLTWA